MGGRARQRDNALPPLSQDPGQTPCQRHRPQPRCTRRPWKHRAATALEMLRAGRQLMRVARGPGERLPKRPRGRQGAPWRTVGEWARLRAGGRGEAPSSFKQTPRRRRAGRAQGHDESRERTGGTCPEGGAGSGASPAEAASSRPQRGRGEGSGGGRRPRGPPPAPPPGQRPWPRARRWFRVVRQQRRRLGYQGAGGGGVQLGHACTCVLSPSTCRRHEGQRGLQGPATHGETRPPPSIRGPRL